MVLDRHIGPLGSANGYRRDIEVFQAKPSKYGPLASLRLQGFSRGFALLATKSDNGIFGGILSQILCDAPKYALTSRLTSRCAPWKSMGEKITRAHDIPSQTNRARATRIMRVLPTCVPTPAQHDIISPLEPAKGR